MESIWRKENIADIVNIVLGAGLFLSPWIFGFASDTTASWNAWLCGVVIAGVAIAAIAAHAEWEEWLNLALGAWVAASPWLIAFNTNMTAVWPHLIVGVVVAVASASRIWLVHDGHPRVTA